MPSFRIPDESSTFPDYRKDAVNVYFFTSLIGTALKYLFHTFKLLLSYIIQLLDEGFKSISLLRMLETFKFTFTISSAYSTREPILLLFVWFHPFYVFVTCTYTYWKITSRICKKYRLMKSGGLLQGPVWNKIWKLVLWWVVRVSCSSIINCTFQFRKEMPARQSVVAIVKYSGTVDFRRHQNLI